jgi:hypothetical protein
VKGIILTLVEEAVVAEHGRATWDAVLARADVDGAYTSPDSYPDDDLVQLADAGAGQLGTTPVELTRHLGEQVIRGLARRYPQYFDPHRRTRELLLSLDEVIYPEVHKLHPDTAPPTFWFTGSDEVHLLVHYRSPRRLCAFAEGMIDGAARHYGEQASLSHEPCMLDGADHCTLLTTFRPAG